MKIITYLLFPLLAFTSTSCGQVSDTAKNYSINQNLKPEYEVNAYKYDSLTIPNFLKTLIENHLVDFYKIDSSSYYELCMHNDIEASDTLNIEKYFTIKILHDLFTSKTASDCSMGDILDIPYFWHWVTPNPRHTIYFVETNQLLSKTKAPLEFSKYNSYADIDRTPYLFLSDLFQEMPKYYSTSCDTFSTFGWCSEREMAFIALTKLLNFSSKVVAEGNHSWSELVIPLKLINGQLQNFIVKVDNTFNSVDLTQIEQINITEWEKKYGSSDLANWYNQKAKSKTELQKISKHLVRKEAMARIENKIVDFLNTKINLYNK